MTTIKSRVNVSAITRQAVLTLPDPNAIDFKRLLAIVRSKVAQNQGDPSIVKDHSVRQAVDYVRQTLKKEGVEKPTKSDWTIAIRRIDAGSAKFRGNGHSQSDNGVNVTLVKTSFDIDLLRQAVAFINAAGGRDNAIAIVNSLTELNPTKE